LEAKPLVYIGKISYGIYLYHLFVPLVLSWFATRLGVSLPGSKFGIFFVNTAGTILLASLSWHVIEKPISIFKDKMKASSNTKEEPVGLLLVE
jgi:peptidoglycan/LPS O-acetylase OafA/YrhL